MSGQCAKQGQYNQNNSSQFTSHNTHKKTTFADYLIIASGGSERQIGALADSVEDKFAENGILPKSIEGKQNSGWMLMDYGDIIVNIFSQEMREKYNIEKVWGDCNFLDRE